MQELQAVHENYPLVVDLACHPADLNDIAGACEGTEAGVHIRQEFRDGVAIRGAVPELSEPARRPDWLPPGWKTDCCPADVTLEPVCQWLDWTIHGLTGAARWSEGDPELSASTIAGTACVIDAYLLLDVLRQRGRSNLPLRPRGEFNSLDAAEELRRVRDALSNPNDTEVYVTLDQMAGIVNRSKKTLERWYLNGIIKGKLPEPDVEGSGGTSHEWKWGRVREPLEELSGKKMPESFPLLRQR